MLKLRSKPKIFYGWWMALSGFGILFYTSGVFFYGFSPFFDEILDEFGWGAGIAAGAFAFQRLEQGIFGPVVGYITDRFGPRKSLLGGIFILGVGFLLLSQITNLWQFYLSFGLLAFGLGFGSFLTVNTAVNAWFVRKRGRAMALVSYGPGLSSLLVPVIVAMIAFFSWRDALIYMAVATWVLCIPLALVMRRSPETYGLFPDGDDKPIGDDPNTKQGQDFTLKQALRTPAFWKYALSSMCGFTFFSALVIHQYVAFKSFGLPDVWAATLVTLWPLASFPGRIVGGILVDMYDTRKVVAGAWALQFIGAVMFVVIYNPLVGLIYAIVFGFGFGLGNPGRLAILGEFFGRKAYGSLLGTQQFLSSMTGIIAPVYAGFMYDIYGADGYRLAFLSLALPGAISVYLYLSMKRPVINEPQTVSQR